VTCVARGLVVALSIAVVATTLPVRQARAAHATDADAPAKHAALKHFNKGEKLYALQRFDEALVEYQAAFDAYPAPEFLFNIGQCYRNLEQYDEAIFSYKKYLRAKPDAENRDAVEKLIAELEQERDEQRREARAHDNRVDPIPKGDGSDAVITRHASHHGGGAFYTRWWFWTGVVVVGGAATTYALTRGGGGLPSSDLGNLDFPR
jgi:hypothetical protein